MHESEISGIVIDTAMYIHRRLGPGLLESAYEPILEYELKKRGLRVERQVPVPLVWEEIELEVGFRADLIVEGKVVLELKAVEQLASIHKKQLLTYLKITGLSLGLVLNFGGELLKNGIGRVVNDLREGE
jgi:GxxExxY protein